MLRGLRIAARLGLSFSRETETAIRSLASSVKSLDKVLLQESSKTTVLPGYLMIFEYFAFSLYVIFVCFLL